MTKGWPIISLKTNLSTMLTTLATLLIYPSFFVVTAILLHLFTLEYIVLWIVSRSGLLICYGVYPDDFRGDTKKSHL